MIIDFQNFKYSANNLQKFQQCQKAYQETSDPKIKEKIVLYAGPLGMILSEKISSFPRQELETRLQRDILIFPSQNQTQRIAFQTVPKEFLMDLKKERALQWLEISHLKDYKSITTHPILQNIPLAEYCVLHETGGNLTESFNALVFGEVSSHFLIPDVCLTQCIPLLKKALPQKTPWHIFWTFLLDDFLKNARYKEKIPLIVLVNPLHRAWHAGVGKFRNKKNYNDFTIGIECVPSARTLENKAAILKKIENPPPKLSTHITKALNHAFNFPYFLPDQLECIQNVLGVLKIPVLGHCDISPPRKTGCPGLQLSHEFLNYPCASNKNVLSYIPLNQCQNLLIELGYDLGENQKNFWDVLTVFCKRIPELWPFWKKSDLPVAVVSDEKLLTPDQDSEIILHITKGSQYRFAPSLAPEFLERRDFSKIPPEVFRHLFSSFILKETLFTAKYRTPQSKIWF